MKKLRIVPDTNVLISAIIKKNSNPRIILEKFLRGEIVFVESEELLSELICVIERTKFNSISREEKTDLIRYLSELSEFVNLRYRFDAIKEDLSDNKVLEAAIAGNADYVVSGDEHLLRLKKFKGIKIVNAREFLEFLGR